MNIQEILVGAVETGEPTERQREVLEAALELIVSGEDALTMAAVARRASCSKETLYKWFGGRDGLLTATVQWQAAKVRAIAVDPADLDAFRLSQALQNFARDWLAVLSSETSVALNRLAVGDARSDGRDLGAIVLRNGPFAMRRRLGVLLESGREAGLLRFDDLDEAFSVFFGLVVRDVQIRLLLGDTPAPLRDAIDRDAERATRYFFALFGVDATAA